MHDARHRWFAAGQVNNGRSGNAGPLLRVLSARRVRPARASPSCTPDARYLAAKVRRVSGSVDPTADGLCGAGEARSPPSAGSRPRRRRGADQDGSGLRGLRHHSRHERRSSRAPARSRPCGSPSWRKTKPVPAPLSSAPRRLISSAPDTPATSGRPRCRRCAATWQRPHRAAVAPSALGVVRGAGTGPGRQKALFPDIHGLPAEARIEPPSRERPRAPCRLAVARNRLTA